MLRKLLILVLLSSLLMAQINDFRTPLDSIKNTDRIHMMDYEGLFDTSHGWEYITWLHE